MKEENSEEMTPEQISKRKYYLKVKDTPEYKAYQKAYQKAYWKTDKYKAYQKAYWKTDKSPEYKAYQKAYRRAYQKKFLRDNLHKFNFITTNGISRFTPEWVLEEKTKEGNKIILKYVKKDGSEKKIQIIDIASRKEKWGDLR
jgi:hypothetical protein